MKFYSPHWLWALLLIPGIYLFLFLDEKRREKQFGLFADRKVWKLIAPEIIPDFRLRKARFLLAAFAFAILALARPQMGAHEETVNVSGLDIMVALDVSNSMNVEDVVPSRLQKAKHVIRSLVNGLNGDRVGLVAFAGSSYVACPLTTDLTYLLEWTQILGPKMISNQGTDVGIGLESAVNAIERGGQESTTKDSALLASHIIILISDGEDHEASAIKAAAKVKEKGVKLYVMGVGTEAGGPIPIKDEMGNALGFKKDHSGKVVVSTFHPQFLQSVAKAADGKYWNITPGETEVQELLQDLKTLSRSDYAERKVLVYEDRFQIPLALAIICLLLEISVPARKILTSIVLLFSSILLSSKAHADNAIKNPASWDAYYENKKGIEAFKKGNLEDAQKEFGAAQARDPMRPELEFNQGTVELKKGNVDRAIDFFKNSARGAEQLNDQSLLGKSLYNLGNAYAKKGDLKEAAEAYTKSIESAEKTQDPTLDYESRKNLQLLLKEQQKQKQKQKEEEQKKKDQKDQDQKKQDGKDLNQSGEGKDQKQDDQKKQGQKNPEKDENTKYRETPKEMRDQPFRSQKLTPEDADRVMSELKTKEQELHEKLQTQNARSYEKSKDW